MYGRVHIGGRLDTVIDFEHEICNNSLRFIIIIDDIIWVKRQGEITGPTVVIVHEVLAGYLQRINVRRAG